MIQEVEKQKMKHSNVLNKKKKTRSLPRKKNDNEDRRSKVLSTDVY